MVSATAPQRTTPFVQNLKKVLLEAKNTMTRKYILGDFNINVQNKTNNSLHNSLKDFMHTFITTRVGLDTSTIIDLILVSDIDLVFKSGVLPYGVSDHDIIFCSRQKPKYFCGEHNTVKLRCLKNYSAESFITALRELDWFDVINCESVDNAWDRFKQLFMQAVDKVAPVKEIRLKQRSQLWFSNEIIQGIHLRDTAYRKFRKFKTPELKKDYNKYRNIVQRRIKTAKKDYVSNTIEENCHSIKKLWRSLKDLGLTGKTKSQSCNIGLKAENGEVNFDKEYVANQFNLFFCNIASKLVEKLPSHATFNSTKADNFYQH